MSELSQKKQVFEGIFWLFSFVVVLLVLLPIYLKEVDYLFWISNIIAIILFITFTRYIFFLKHTPFSHYTPFKLVFIFLALPILLLLVDGMSTFQAYHDEIGLQEMMKNIGAADQTAMMKYIKTEFLFFSVAAMIATFVLPFRMIISIWRVRNKGTV